MAGVLSIYVAAEANAEPTVVMHLHPDIPLPDLAALGLRLGALAMAEAAKPPWFPGTDGLPKRDGAHASLSGGGAGTSNTGAAAGSAAGGGGRAK